MSSRLTVLACAVLAVLAVGSFSAAAQAQVVHKTWSKTYELKPDRTKTYRLNLPSGFEKAKSPGAANYALYPSSGPGFAVGGPIGAHGGKQKAYLGVTVLRSSFDGHAVSVTVRTGDLKRPMALELSARGTA